MSEIVHEVKSNPWKLGVIYADPDDPRLVVPHRIGLGWTLNMAQPKAWLIVAGILGFWLLRRKR
ncbi:MAG TPA: DUF5808 domain-containing protein [Thermomicrobiales bacterium]